MLLWLDQEPANWQIVELFSGQGCVSEVFRQSGRSVCSYDKVLGGPAMDILTPAGFAFLPQALLSDNNELYLQTSPLQGGTMDCDVCRCPGPVDSICAQLIGVFSCMPDVRSINAHYILNRILYISCIYGNDICYF